MIMYPNPRDIEIKKIVTNGGHAPPRLIPFSTVLIKIPVGALEPFFVPLKFPFLRSVKR